MSGLILIYTIILYNTKKEKWCCQLSLQDIIDCKTHPDFKKGKCEKKCI